MSKTIKIKKGLNIKLKGNAELSVSEANATMYGIRPTDFHGLTPKLCVKDDDIVKAGTVLFYDKNHPEVKFTSPVSGKVVTVNRGERRRILEVEIESDGKFDSENFSAGGAPLSSRETIKQLLLDSGLWPFIIQRPFGIIAKPADTPRDIFISGFDSAPLAPDYDFALGNDLSAFQAGIDALAKLTDGKVYLGVRSGSKLAQVKTAEVNFFDGPHPAGNVGVQIHHIKPINKGDVVWTVNPQAVVFIGRLFTEGKLNLSKLVALTGSEVKAPKYVKTVVGAKVSSIVSGKTAGECKERIISGNVLTGVTSELDDYLGFYHNQITVIPEGDNYEFLGWAMPRFNKFSFSRAYFSWLTPGKTYRADANLNGEERAYVMTGQYEKVLPMDVLPVHLIKSIMADDIDKMELLGIYEVIEEDLALCEYVCTSKIEVQYILRKGIDLIVKELG
jgi:Na+-transporting NADH:ubiquinone oxidoreductase subunit A